MSNDHEIDSSSKLDRILQKASQEILAKQEDGFCFTIDNSETTNESTYNSPYDTSELAEFGNFDMLGEEGDNIKPFQHLTDRSNYEDLTNNGGVLKVVLDPGIGQIVPDDSIVLLHYIGYISNLHEPFDVTYLQGKRPKRFRLGVGDLLPGLEIGILTMKHGENARIIISPQYAYRELGCPPRIPPNATVLFDVHLVSYFSPDNFPLYFDENNKDPMRFETNLKVVKKLHFEGNEHFKSKNIREAVFKYEKAKEILHLTGCNNDKQEIDMFKYLNKLYSNLSICYLKQCAFNKVCRMGSEAMKYSERFSKNNTKLWFNWGKALRFLKDFTAAKKKLQRALKIEPTNLTIKYELDHLERDAKFHERVNSLVTFKNDTDEDDNKRFPQEFWQVFDTNIKEFLDCSDDVLTVVLNNNADDIKLAEHKANLYNLKFQPVLSENAKKNCFAFLKEL